MKVYFLSSIPCALTLNGCYFGVTDMFERFAEVSLKEGVFAQFSPQDHLSVGCFLTENLRFSPPEGFEVYLLPDGICLYARDFPPRDFALKTHGQLREGDTLVTLFSQGELQLSIESAQGLFLARPPRALATAKIRFFGELVGLDGEHTLALYTKTGACVFCENVLSFSVDGNELIALLPLSDALGRVADCRYTLSAKSCVRTAITLRQARTEKGETDAPSVAAALLPYAFFESVLLGLPFAHLLTPSLAQKADDLRAFLGDFVAVVPTRDTHVCGLVKRKGERLYEMTRYTVDVEGDKISDIRA